MEVLQTTSIVQFDAWDLKINKASSGDGLTDFSFDLISNPRINTEPDFSDVLQVTLDREYSVGEIVNVVVDYTTIPGGNAFSWLTAA